MKWRRRNDVEAVISAMKRSNRLDRNHLSGREGDRINAVLAACGYNLRKLLRELVALIFRLLSPRLSAPSGSPRHACGY